MTEQGESEERFGGGRSWQLDLSIALTPTLPQSRQGLKLVCAELHSLALQTAFPLPPQDLKKGKRYGMSAGQFTPTPTHLRPSPHTVDAARLSRGRERWVQGPSRY